MIFFAIVHIHCGFQPGSTPTEHSGSEPSCTIDSNEPDKHLESFDTLNPGATVTDMPSTSGDNLVKGAGQEPEKICEGVVLLHANARCKVAINKGPGDGMSEQLSENDMSGSTYRLCQCGQAQLLKIFRDFSVFSYLASMSLTHGVLSDFSRDGLSIITIHSLLLDLNLQIQSEYTSTISKLTWNHVQISLPETERKALLEADFEGLWERVVTLMDKCCGEVDQITMTMNEVTESAWVDKSADAVVEQLKSQVHERVISEISGILSGDLADGDSSEDDDSSGEEATPLMTDAISTMLSTAIGAILSCYMLFLSAYIYNRYF